MLELCDRIVVLFNGRITGIVNPKETTKAMMGLLMTDTYKNKETDNMEDRDA